MTTLCIIIGYLSLSCILGCIIGQCIAFGATGTLRGQTPRNGGESNPTTPVKRRDLLPGVAPATIDPEKSPA